MDETSSGGIIVSTEGGVYGVGAENPEHYEHHHLPDLAVRGSGITLGVPEVGACGVGMFWMGTRRTCGVDMEVFFFLPV